MKENENLPVVIEEKQSFFKRLFNKLFKKQPKVSKIEQLASRLEQPLLDENKKEQFIPDKRTKVYDFFKNNIPKGQPSKYGFTRFAYKNGYEREINFTDLDGKQGIITLIKQEPFADQIVIEGKSIKITGVDDEYDLPRDLWGDIMNLLQYNEFVNSPEEAKIFKNEVGRTVKQVSENYNLEHFIGALRAGEKLYYELIGNPIYMGLRNDFDEIYSEYLETYEQFRENEENRKKAFDEEHAFRDGIRFSGSINHNVDRTQNSNNRSNNRTR